ncbi:MAG: hypothetical protein M3160_04585 [Candidatus Eremiobacteraeota bacterium]|nr:hypothetical protein [Candidatus Eremiobacteraeota bacterium]
MDELRKNGMMAHLLDALDSGNVYRDLKFPDDVYEHIGHYREAKAQAQFRKSP